jgi:hypothetical protein
MGISKPAPAMRAVTATAPARPVGSEMVIRVRGYNAACDNMNIRRMNDRCRGRRDAQNRAGNAEGQDSGNDESSPDTHDSSMAISLARGSPPDPLARNGATTVSRT